MSKYTGCKCPACQQTFTDTDDIVVCPDCGTPYHRSCWEKNKVCLSAAKHGTGYEWEPDNKPQPKEDEIVCPGCGTANPAGSRFCNGCGHPLPQPEPTADSASAASRPGANPQAGPQAGGVPPFTANGPEAFRSGPYIYERKLGPEDEIDGIKAKEWAACVGKSSTYYLLNFQRMADNGRRFVVNFSAMLFGPLYFFYRKMWKWGVLFTLLFLATNLPSVLYLLTLTESAYTAWVNISVLERIMDTCVIVDWIILILRGLFAVSLYRDTLKQKIHRLQAEFPNENDRMAVMVAEGGTSLKAVTLFVLVYFVFILVVTRMAGPGLYTLAASLYG